MVDAILIEHAVGVVHPTVEWGVVVLRTELLPIDRVEVVALLEFLPAEKVLHGTSKTTVAVECDVEKQVLGSEAGNVEWHVVVHLVNSQLRIQRLHQLSANQYLDVCVLFSLLHGQQQVLTLHFHTLHGVALSQHLRLVLCRGSGKRQQQCHHRHNQFLHYHYVFNYSKNLLQRYAKFVYPTINNVSITKKNRSLQQNYMQ